MKAKDYVQKYFENVSSQEDLAANAYAMFNDMLKEFDELNKRRKPKTVDGIAGIVRELNEKWNAVVAKVEQKFDTHVLKRNVPWNIMLAEKFSDAFKRKPD